jgi:AcrR family transcriptional regulator
LFAQRGFDGVTMPMIAAASGITPGAIYKHFKGKAELFFEVVRRAVESGPMAAGPPGESLAATVAGYTGKHLKRFRQLAVEVHYASARHPEVRKLLRRSMETDIGRMSAGIAEAQRRGAADPDADPKLTAVAAMVFILGLMHMETLAPELVGDAAWRAAVRDRFDALIGLR